MRRVGQHRPRPRRYRDLDHPLRVGRHDQLIGQVVLHDALNDPGDERLAGQKLERFVGETGRAKTCRNDTKDAHHGN